MALDRMAIGLDRGLLDVMSVDMLPGDVRVRIQKLRVLVRVRKGLCRGKHIAQYAFKHWKALFPRGTATAFLSMQPFMSA